MATETVTRSKRTECWNSRDLFYACLDSNNNDESKCKDLQSKYEASCPKAWRKRFEERRQTSELRSFQYKQPKVGSGWHDK